MFEVNTFILAVSTAVALRNRAGPLSSAHGSTLCPASLYWSSAGDGSKELSRTASLWSALSRFPSLQFQHVKYVLL
jgi:hypothetical protein